MGGNAIKTVEVSRFDIETYNNTKELLKKVFEEEGIVIDFCYEMPGKQDYGDLDVLYQNKTSRNIVDIIKERFNPVEYHKNGDVISFAYNVNNKYYQVDMIKTKDFECYKFYLSYSDVGNIIGKMLKHYEVHFGMQGLFVKPVIGGSTRQIILTTDPKEICEFLGVRYDVWSSFESVDQIFEWITYIKYFNSSIYFNNLKYNDKVKKDRKYYQWFLEYIRERDIVSSIEKRDMTEELIIQYGKQDEYAEYIKEYEIDKSRKEKFNGKKFMKYGYENKEVAIVMNKFKIFIEEGLDINFNNWLDSVSNESVDKWINYFHTH